MYSGFVLFAVGTTLLLGSAYGLFGAALLIVMVAWRAVQEERVLGRELKGYGEYKKRVRYRIRSSPLVTLPHPSLRSCV